MLKHFSGELQMALAAALHARVRADIAWAEATVSAKKADSFALVLLGIVQNIFVELVLLQLFVAGIAAPRVSVALALDAVFCLVVEGSYIFDLAARRAAVARRAAQTLVPRCLPCVFPLRCWKLTLW